MTEQLPVLADEIIRWGIASHIMYLVVCLLVAAGLAAVAVGAWQAKKEAVGDEIEFLEVVITICSVVAFGVLVIGVLVNVNALLAAIYTPGLYIIEYCKFH